jgi:hypothetical protein
MSMSMLMLRQFVCVFLLIPDSRLNFLNPPPPTHTHTSLLFLSSDLIFDDVPHLSPLDHETRAAQTDKCPAPVSPRSKHVGTPQPAGPTNLWLWLWPLSEAVTIGRSPAGTRCSLAPEGSRAPPGLTAAPELSPRHPLCLAGCLGWRRT